MRQAPTYPVVVVPSAARNAAGDSGPLSDWGGRKPVVAKLIVSAISGAAATLNLTLEHADAPGGPYTAFDTFPAQTTTTPGITRSSDASSKPYARVAWTITGTTPSVTFSVALARTEGLMVAG